MRDSRFLTGQETLKRVHIQTPVPGKYLGAFTKCPNPSWKSEFIALPTSYILREFWIAKPPGARLPTRNGGAQNAPDDTMPALPHLARSPVRLPRRGTQLLLFLPFSKRASYSNAGAAAGAIGDSIGLAPTIGIGLAILVVVVIIALWAVQEWGKKAKKLAAADKRRDAEYAAAGRRQAALLAGHGRQERDPGQEKEERKPIPPRGTWRRPGAREHGAGAKDGRIPELRIDSVAANGEEEEEAGNNGFDHGYRRNGRPRGVSQGRSDQRWWWEEEDADGLMAAGTPDPPVTPPPPAVVYKKVARGEDWRVTAQEEVVEAREATVCMRVK
ncbi:hypothetical protein MKZ38_008198 [Zalerion maritima]|uniref:Uncharacterized protein n=1 Tax=Zalerion maritima TaxID=339359 RepID=A0AAD5WML5_9PEZI|nr:hypothetical protein MKZ38_008198 [Zalerion maritima]